MNTVQTSTRLSSYVDGITLAAATNEVVTVPTGYSSCIITPTGATWVRRAATAVAGISDVVDGTASLLIPANTSRNFDLRTNAPEAIAASFAMICTAGCQVSIEWFK